MTFNWKNPRHRHDCVHFDGIRPCHVSATCEACLSFASAKHHLLIMLFGRLGDVLILTGLLPALAKRYSTSRITWVTDALAIPLLQLNPFVHRVLPGNVESCYLLQAEAFDVVLNFDRWPLAARLASSLCAPIKAGFGLSSHGTVVPLSPESELLFDLNRYAEFRSHLQTSWIEIYHAVAKVPMPSPPPLPLLFTTANEKARAQRLREDSRRNSKLLVAVCPGSDAKDKQKRWPADLLASAMQMLMQDGRFQLMVVVGPDESDSYCYLSERFGPLLVNIGIQSSVRGTIEAILAADIVITMDSFTLHASLGLMRPTVALFGPTSPYLVPDVWHLRRLRRMPECPPCYQRVCRLDGSTAAVPCMAAITPLEVYSELCDLLSASQTRER